MVEPTNKPSAYEDGGGAFHDGGGVSGDPRAPGRETGGATGPDRPDPSRESTNASVKGKFENPFEKLSPANKVPFDFEREVGNVKNRSAEAEARRDAQPNFGVNPETGEPTSWKDLDGQYMRIGDARQLAEDGTFADPRNDPLPSSAAQSTLDLSMQGQDDIASSDSGESDGVTASVDSSSEGGDENV